MAIGAYVTVTTHVQKGDTLADKIKKEETQSADESKSIVKTNSADNATKQAAKIGDEVDLYYECLLHPRKDILVSHTTGLPYKLVLGDGQVCQGMTNAIVGMENGTQKNYVCSPEDGYGASGLPPLIPPNATLEFNIKLIDIKPFNLSESQ